MGRYETNIQRLTKRCEDAGITVEQLAWYCSRGRADGLDELDPAEAGQADGILDHITRGTLKADGWTLTNPYANTTIVGEIV